MYDDTSLRLQYDRLFHTDIICIGHSSTSASAVDLETEVHYLDDTNEFTKIALVTTKDDQIIGGQVLAARLGSRVGYQILERVQKGSKLKEKPLLVSRHERIKELLERTLGPIE
jgi:biotin operon repressor